MLVPGKPPTDAPEVDQPVTYYELFTGRRDPHRESFLAARRVLNVLGWTLAALPFLFIVAVGIINGESLATIALMGFFGAVVGMMLKRSLPSY